MDSEPVKQNYYQWVCFVLTFQALLFKFPNLIWKSQENGKIKLLLKDLKEGEINTENFEERTQKLSIYLMKNAKKHKTYLAWFVFCEFLNLLNVLGQIYFIDFFLGGEFFTYGPKVFNVLNTDYQNRTDPMR